MLIELNLINWKTHENSKFSFMKGVNLLVGIMGSGKSSVTDGISYALFGTFPDLNRRKVKLTDLIMKNNSGQKTSCSVELLFSVDNDLYRVVRKINEIGGTEAVLEKNRSVIQEQTTKVNEEIEGGGAGRTARHHGPAEAAGRLLRNHPHGGHRQETTRQHPRI